MSAIAEKEKTYTIEEYLKLESSSLEKLEFDHGKIIKMSGADPIHNIIAVRIMAELLYALDKKDKEYFVLNSDQKIQIPDYDQFVYPDAVVICEHIEYYPGSNAIVNPLLIVEVLSPGTESYARSGKFIKYKSIPSFMEYVLVRQDKAWVSASYRQETHLWADTISEGLDTEIYLRSIDCSLSLKRIYRGVKFE
jgi:Uma2 family endonuclease